MLLRKFQLLILLFVAAHGLSQSAFISVSGDEIIGPDGKNFLIRGTNLGNWLVPEGYMFKFKNANSPRLINETLSELIGPDATSAFWKHWRVSYISAGDIHYMKSIGMNSIRVPFNYRIFTDPDYLGGLGETKAFELLDKLVGWCRSENLYILLDMHCAPGGQTGDNIDDGYGYPFLFDSQESQDLTVSVWRKIAEHYKNEPFIMGYDLLNEPIAHYFDASHFNPLLEPLYKRIVRAIREVDPNHIVFLGGSQWDSNFKPFGPPFDAKSVYTFHKYWTATTQEVIQEYLDFRTKYKVPIYCGETGENDNAWIVNFRKLLEKNNIGWHFWPYKKMDDPRGIVTFNKPAGYSEISQFADSVRGSFESIRNLRPKNQEAIQKALDEFISNSLFQNCRPNSGYIEALGLGK
ncbi:MAG: glycoside hydrolase family 5 protein [Chitinophagales bacterium]